MRQARQFRLFAPIVAFGSPTWQLSVHRTAESGGIESLDWSSSAR